MRKVELLEEETAVLESLLEQAIDEADDYVKWNGAHIRDADKANEAPKRMYVEDYDYWKNKLHILRQLKAKLEREEE